MDTATKLTITEQDYLDGELKSDVKHEYVDGQVWAMTGTSDDHNRISSNLFGKMLQQLAF